MSHERLISFVRREPNWHTTIKGQSDRELKYYYRNNTGTDSFRGFVSPIFLTLLTRMPFSYNCV